MKNVLRSMLVVLSLAGTGLSQDSVADRENFLKGRTTSGQPAPSGPTNTSCDGVKASSSGGMVRTYFLPTASGTVSLGTAQLMMASGTNIQTVMPGNFSVSGFAVNSIPATSFNTFSAPRATGVSTLGYAVAPTVNVIRPMSYSSTADYTVYYRGVGSVLLNSARYFPVGDGTTLVPVYVPTVVARPVDWTAR